MLRWPLFRMPGKEFLMSWMRQLQVPSKVKAVRPSCNQCSIGGDDAGAKDGASGDVSAAAIGAEVAAACNAIAGVFGYGSRKTGKSENPGRGRDFLFCFNRYLSAIAIILSAIWSSTLYPIEEIEMNHEALRRKAWW
jgi:hypothetical protein